MNGAPGKLVVLGLSALDWDGAMSRLEAGRLPALARLIARGAAYRLAPSWSPVGPAAWATIASGYPPEEHGVLLAEEAWAGGLRPAGRQSWARDPAWLRLAEAGVRTASIAWPASAPGQAWPGVHVDARLAQPTGRTRADWLAPRDVAPEPWRSRLAELRVHPADISGAMLLPLVPGLDAIDQSRDHRLVELALALAELSTIHAGATTLIEDGEWDALFVHHRWLARIDDGFENAKAPFDRVTDAAWTLLDALIGATAAALRPNATLLLVSPGGRGRGGLLVAAGPGIDPRKTVAAATIFDLAPTMLATFGVADAALPGRALLRTAIAARPAPPHRGPRPPIVPDAKDLARVGAFGHVPPEPPRRWRAMALATQAEHMLARDPAAAGQLAEAALAVEPVLLRALGTRAAAHVMAEEADPLPALADRIAAVAPGHLWEALVRAGFHALRKERALARPYLERVEREGGGEELIRAGAAWLMLKRPDDAARAFEAALGRQPESVAALLGLAAAKSGRPIDAEQALRRAIAIDPNSGAARAALAELLTAMGRSAEAETVRTRA